MPRHSRLFHSRLLPGLALLLAALPLRAEWIGDRAQLRALLAGNSLYGQYNDLQFRQIIHADGRLTVAINGESGLHHATWYISERAEYCETWPDHTSCFRVGRTDTNRLQVQGRPEDRIESYWYEGEIDLDFVRTPAPSAHGDGGNKQDPPRRQ